MSDHLHELAREIRILNNVITKITHQAFEQRLSESDAGISGLQFGILRTLYHQSFTSSELSRKFVLDPSTLVPVIDALEKKGFIERGKDPNDRRRAPLSLTEAGGALLARCPVFDDSDVLAQALVKLGETRAEEMRVLLRDLLQNMPDGEAIMQEVQQRLRHFEEFARSRNQSAG